MCISEHGHHHDHDQNHSHEHNHPNQKAVSNRLAKAIGHLEKVKRMVDNGEDCSEILIQMAAVRSAINAAGQVLLSDHLTHCLIDAARDGDQKALDDFTDAMKLFMR